MKKSRVLALATVLVVGLLLILPYFVEGLQWSIVESGALYLLGMLALIPLLLTNPVPKEDKLKSRGGEGGEIKTVTSLACYGCKFSEEREFRRGDFVGKVLGKCLKCGGQQYIRAIYAVEEKRARR